MKNRLAILLALAVLFCAAVPGVAEISTVGIPADSHIYYGADFTQPQLASFITDTFTKLRGTKEFEQLLDKLSAKAGFKLGLSMLDVYESVSGMGAGLIANTQTPDAPPTLIAVVHFKNEAGAKKAEAMLREKIAAEFVKDIAVSELKVGDHALVSLDRTEEATNERVQKAFKKVTFNYLLAGNKVAIYIVPKKDDENRKVVLANVGKSLAVLDGVKGTVAERKEFGDLLARTAANTPFALFISDDFIQLMNKQNPNPAAGFLSYIGMATIPSANLSNFKSVFLAVLKDLEKNPLAKDHLPLIKSLFAGGDCGMASLPEDTVFAFGLTLNITKEHMAFPPIAQQIAEMKKGGIDLEELLLSWFGGELAIGVSKYDMPSDEDLKKQIFNMPDLYISLKSKDAAATMKAVENLFKLSPMPLMPTDVTVAGQAVKAIPLPIAPPQVKKLALHYGVIGDFLVITTTKEAMEKAVGVAGKKVKPLTDSALYKECVTGAGFAAFFAHVEELTKMDKITKIMNPGAKAMQDLPTFQKGLGMVLSFPGDAVKLVFGQRVDVEEAVKTIIEKLKKHVPTMK